MSERDSEIRAKSVYVGQAIQLRSASAIANRHRSAEGGRELAESEVGHPEQRRVGRHRLPVSHREAAIALALASSFGAGACGNFSNHRTAASAGLATEEQCLANRKECLGQVWKEQQSLLSLLNYEHRHMYADLQRQLDWLLCPDKPVRDFINNCATDLASGERCTVATAEEIVKQMDSYPHQMLYYDRIARPAVLTPDETKKQVMNHVRMMDPIRKEQLREFAARYPLVPNTRLLVMFMPYSRNRAITAEASDRAEGERIAFEVRNHFLKEVWPLNRSKEDGDELQPLTPREVGCFERNMTLKKYLTHPNNIPLKSEKHAHTVVWLFLLNCGMAKPAK